MTRQEFEKLTGERLTAYEFQSVHNIYMTCGEMTKEAFCAEWKKIGGSQILLYLWVEVRTLRNDLINKDEEIRVYLRERNEIFSFLLERAQQMGDTELRKRACQLGGERAVVLEKLGRHLPLWEDDEKYIKLHL